MTRRISSAFIRKTRSSPQTVAGVRRGPEAKARLRRFPIRQVSPEVRSPPGPKERYAPPRNQAPAASPTVS